MSKGVGAPVRSTGRIISCVACVAGVDGQSVYENLKVGNEKQAANDLFSAWLLVCGRLASAFD